MVIRIPSPVPPGALALLAAISIACAARGDGTASAPPGRESATLRVVNRSWADMRVFAARDGARVPLDFVTAGGTVELRLPPDLLAAGGTLRLLADPVGSTLVFASEPFQVAPGQTVEWTIRPLPQHSTVVVH